MVLFIKKCLVIIIHTEVFYVRTVPSLLRKYSYFSENCFQDMIYWARHRHKYNVENNTNRIDT